MTDPEANRDPGRPPDDGGGKLTYTERVPAATTVEDRGAYRIAVGGVALALVAFLIGAAIIAGGGNPVPTEYWSAGSGLAGGLLGILAPNPTKNQTTSEAREKRWVVLTGVVTFLKDLWDNRAVVLLMAVFGVSVGFGIDKNSPELLTVASAAGGALVGLLAPPPGKTG